MNDNELSTALHFLTRIICGPGRKPTILKVDPTRLLITVHRANRTLVSDLLTAGLIGGLTTGISILFGCEQSTRWIIGSIAFIFAGTMLFRAKDFSTLHDTIYESLNRKEGTTFSLGSRTNASFIIEGETLNLRVVSLNPLGKQDRFNYTLFLHYFAMVGNLKVGRLTLATDQTFESNNEEDIITLRPFRFAEDGLLHFELVTSNKAVEDQ